MRVLLKKASPVSRTSPSQHSSRATILSQPTVEASKPSPQENYVDQFLARFPDYRKALWLAARSEEEGLGNPSYQGWQWSDIEMHPTRVLKLVIEGIAKINMRTRRATYYLLKEPDLVKTVLKSSILKK
ncbi:MAG: hypothetical protein AUI97_02480 [Crenarchaeota archaeon 13_1_40CM_3_52_17]|nr:MAG: hypothetical protein AUI97_02480 [Crenarchaeota archaeon 13_1_40CM_3_52_17]